MNSLRISRETKKQIDEYQRLLLKWNEKINLISKNALNDFWQRHILDSLQLMQFISSHDIEILDIGSGAGLPGLILSFAGIKCVRLVESDSRKAAFLYEAAKISCNKVTVINDRIENLSLACDVITARAFAELARIFELTKKITIRQKYLLLKGENYQKELANAQKTWLFDIEKYDSITSNKSKILAIKNLTCINDKN